MRNMSFMLTVASMRAREKDVTRRLGWWFLEPGTVVCAIEKGQGLKAGEQVVRLGTIRITGVRSERLDKMIENAAYGQIEVRREGFPQMSPMEFITMFCASHAKCLPSSVVNRIQFEHLGEKE